MREKSRSYSESHHHKQLKGTPLKQENNFKPQKIMFEIQICLFQTKSFLCDLNTSQLLKMGAPGKFESENKFKIHFFVFDRKPYFEENCVTNLIANILFGLKLFISRSTSSL